MINKNWKTAMIIGAGISGLSAAKLLKKKGFRIYISDTKNKSDIKKLPKNITFIKEEKAKYIIDKIDFFIKSPGIPHNNIILKQIKKLSKPLFSEIDLALFFSKTQNIIAITGTNGKTTTTVLTYLIMNNHLLKKGAKAILCGNVGKPATQEITKANENDWIIMEVSSYQLEDSHYLSPKISAILNITPDHIEHHLSMKNYIKAKEKIFLNQLKDNYSIFNYDDGILKKISLKSPAQKLYFSSKQSRKINAFIKGKTIKIDFCGKTYFFNPPDVPGKHNIENAMAAALCSLCAGADKNAIQKTFNNFKGIEHRIENVATIKGIKFINDSKATNVNSTLIALKSIGFKKNIWLILGGLDKGAPYKPLYPLIKKYVKNILTVGTAAKKIEKELKKAAKIIPAVTIKNAIKYIYKNAKNGDIALLSPACASYDQFKDFEDRGKKFKKWIKLLEK